MKHLTIFTFVLLLLAGCQTNLTTGEDNELVQPTEHSNTEKADEQEVTTEESERAMLNRTLSNELVQLILDYGIRPDAQIINNDQDRTGIVYAELVDFDADGQKELYVFTKAVRDKEQWSGDDTELYDNYYIHEVWKAAPDYAVRVFSEEIDAAYCESCGTEVKFSEKEDGTWRLHVANAAYNDDGAVFRTVEHELLGNGMVPKVFELETSDQAGDTFTIDGEVVEEQRYRNELASVEGSESTILTNIVGQMDFAFDGAAENDGITNSSATVVSNVLAQLHEGMNTLAQTGTAANIDEMLSYIETFNDMGRMLDDTNIVDIQNTAFHNEMLGYLLINRIWLTESDLPDDELAAEMGYLAYSFDLVNAQHEKLYGIPIDLSEITYEEPEYGAMGPIIYKDGVFYVTVSELAPPIRIHDIKGAYEIGPNTYYIEATVREFEWLDYLGSLTYEQQFEMPDYESLMHNEDPANWPFEVRSFAMTGLKRYAVIQVNGDDLVLRYYHYVPISDAELDNYL